MARILFVEDDPDVRPLLAYVLASAGHSVEVAETALKAASLLENNSYDLVVADSVLPDGSGVAIADQAKARGIRALMITGYTLQVTIEDLDRYEYLLKPFHRKELLRAVALQLEAAARKEPSLTVLFVEDDIAVRDMVISALSAKGLGVLTARDAEEALHILVERPVDLLVADIVLPGIDGVELAEQAKLMRPAIKVLFMTGFPIIAGETEVLRHGKLLYKPQRPAELLREVEAALAA